MGDDDLRRCPRCRKIFVEDSRLHDPETCPHCGAEMDDGLEATSSDEEGV